MSLALSFDIGYSSIGWAAINVGNSEPDIFGCGSVVFPSEDCQNQQRSAFRRQRRHIAATRNRIKRLERYLVQIEALTEAQVLECRRNPHPWPWLLAARVIVGRKELNASELWSVIRWYAHNRGYDGNALWASEDADLDDVKKVQAACELMDKQGTGTMCETVCSLLDADPLADENPSPKHYFKGENAAFPRAVVFDECRRAVQAHIGKLDCVTENFVSVLFDDWHPASSQGYEAKLPERYSGGLLFGQMKPRFENRIIPKCRITGEKTPSKHSREFYHYRWAMLTNNLRVADAFTGLPRPLDSAEREQLHEIMSEVGFFTKATLKKAFEKQLKLEPSNLEAMLMVPEMEHALTLDPAKREVATSRILKKVWPKVPDAWKPVFLNQLFAQRNFRGQPPSLAQWKSRLVADGQDLSAFEAAVQAAYETESMHLAKKNITISLDELMNRPIRLSKRHVASGRAPYSRSKLREATEWVMRGDDPRVVGGPIEESLEVRSQERDAGIDQNSNNHLVRHRMKIFTKTLRDLVKRYAGDDPAKVEWVGIEVVRDLVQFSGKTAKEKAMLMGQQLWHHRKIVKFLEDEREATGGSWNINAGLIKKVRIADDMGWNCPFTGKAYSLNQILNRDVDVEHIIPRSSRPTDALHALTLTFTHINKEKGARTALQYIQDTAEQSHTLPPNQYREFIGKLKSKNGPAKEDESRCTKRKIALLTEHYEKRGRAKKANEVESLPSFTEGSLSQTSYLNKLAAQQTKAWFAGRQIESSHVPQVIHLSGSVTAATRRTWDLLGAISQACPAAKDKNKTDIREITHLHHALDAIVIGLSAHYFPRDGRLWALMSRRKIGNASDQAYMRDKLGDKVRFCADGKWEIKDLANTQKERIAECLLEKRVVRHNPRTMRGLRVQQNIWRVEGEDPDDVSKMVISMRPRNEDGVKPDRPKRKSERKTKLLGAFPETAESKLKALKGAFIVEDNYGVALDPEPKVIPHRQVWKQLNDLRKLNNGSAVRVLRNGDVIEIEEGRYKGRWRVHSIKDAKSGIALDLAYTDLIRVENKGYGSKRMVLLNTLLKNGMTLRSQDYSGGD